MENIGDKVLMFRNVEDILSAFTLEVLNMNEVSQNEYYFEIKEEDFFIPVNLDILQYNKKI